MSNSQYTTGIYQVWKHEGETLSVLLDRIRFEEKLGKDVKMTYAGRLDPMAEGVVVLLVDSARFEKEKYNALSKTYELTVLLGIQTDTADMLGIAQKINIIHLSEEKIIEVTKRVRTISELPYPMYSSRPVDGKPLFVHARAGRAVEVPIKKVSIRDVELLEIKKELLKSYIDRSLTVIQNVVGDFRQQEIVDAWNVLRDEKGNQEVQLVKIKVTVSSGTYMRSLAEWIGNELGAPSLAYNITRTSIALK